MSNLSSSEIIRSNPIGDGFDAFRNSFNAACGNLNISSYLDQIGNEGDVHRPVVKFSLTCIGRRNLVLDLILALQILPASRLLPSSRGGRNLFDNLLRLNS